MKNNIMKKFKKAFIVNNKKAEKEKKKLAKAKAKKRAAFRKEVNEIFDLIFKAVRLVAYIVGIVVAIYYLANGGGINGLKEIAKFFIELFGVL